MSHTLSLKTPHQKNRSDYESYDIIYYICKDTKKSAVLLRSLFAYHPNRGYLKNRQTNPDYPAHRQSLQLAAQSMKSESEKCH